MSFGYPGDNLHLEHHGVSEESFWPSFTDIMMVIVMVFLLVTVAVILNNWTLIADLKESINAHKVASTLAENKEVENIGLEAKLDYLEEQLVLFKNKTAEEQAKVVETQAQLGKSQKLVAELTTLSKEQKVLLEESEKSLAVAQLSIQKKDKKISLITQQQDETNLSLENKLLALTLMRNNSNSLKTKLTNLEAKQAQLQASLVDANKKLDTQTKVSDEATKKIASMQKELAVANEALSNNKIALNDSKAKLELLNKENDEQEEALQRMEAEKQRIIMALNEKFTTSQAELSSLKQITSNTETSIAEAKSQVTEIEARVADAEIKLKEAEKKAIEAESRAKVAETKVVEAERQAIEAKDQIEKKENTIVALQKFRQTSEVQLRSLQGEYDTLDSKYQKLLRPARSSKGKYIVSVSYRKKGGKKTIRLKAGPNAEYKTLKRSEMEKALSKLKKKHKKDLYVKIVIPENSGLSYNEAWRFTSGLQKQYDYYFQPDSKTIKKEKTSKDTE